MTSPLDRIPDLARWLAAAGLDVLELTGPDGHVRLRRGAGEAALAPAPGNAETTADIGRPDVVTSPGVGHFLHAHPLRTTPLAGPGDAVAAGQPIGLLRIGAVLIPLPASRDGVVASVIAQDGTLVGYGDPLIALRPRS